MKHPKISIIIATFNVAETLEACLASIFKQTYANYEILIADGLSQDRTPAILSAHSDKIAHQISEVDSGIYDAWNKVLPQANGDWIFFLGADDELWDEHALAKAAAELAGTSENVVYGKVAIVLPSGEILNFEGEPWGNVKARFRHEMTIPHQGVFHRKTLFAKYGLFDPSFRICGDYEFLLRELKDHDAYFISDLIVSKMGFGGASSTLKNVPRIIEELDRAQKKNGFSRTSMSIHFRRLRYFTRIGIRRVFGDRIADSIADVYRRAVGKPTLWGRFHE